METVKKVQEDKTLYEQLQSLHNRVHDAYHLKKQSEQSIKMRALLSADKLASAEMTGRLKERKEITDNPEKYGLCKKPAWSEEDEKGFGDALWAIKQARTIAKDENDMGNLWYAEQWLKSLKAQKGE